MAKPIPYSSIEAIIEALKPALDSKNKPSKENIGELSKDSNLLKNKRFATKLSILERKRLSILYDLFYKYGEKELNLLSEKLIIDRSRILKEQKINFLFQFKAVPDETKSEKLKRILKNIGLALLFFNLLANGIKLFGGPDIKKMIYNQIRSSFIKKDTSVQDTDLQKMLGEDMVEKYKKELIQKFNNRFLLEIFLLFNKNVMDMLFYFFNVNEIAKLYQNKDNVKKAMDDAEFLIFDGPFEKPEELRNRALTFLEARKKLKALIFEMQYKNIPDEEEKENIEDFLYTRFANNIVDYQNHSLELGGLQGKEYEEKIFNILCSLRRKNGKKNMIYNHEGVDYKLPAQNSKLFNNPSFTKEEIAAIIRDTEALKDIIEDADKEEVKQKINEIKVLTANELNKAKKEKPDFFRIPSFAFNREKVLKTIFEVDNIENIDYSKLNLKYTLPDYDEFITSFKESYVKFDKSIVNTDVNLHQEVSHNSIKNIEIPVIVRSAKIDLKNIINDNIKILEKRVQNNKLIKINIDKINKYIKAIDAEEKKKIRTKEYSRN